MCTLGVVGCVYVHVALCRCCGVVRLGMRKTPPCVDSKRLRVCVQDASVCTWKTRACVRSSTGDVPLWAWRHVVCVSNPRKKRCASVPDILGTFVKWTWTSAAPSSWNTQPDCLGIFNKGKEPSPPVFRFFVGLTVNLSMHKDASFTESASLSFVILTFGKISTEAVFARSSRSLS